MVCKKKKATTQALKYGFELGRAKTEQMKGRDKTMLQKETVYWQEVNSE